MNFMSTAPTTDLVADVAAAVNGLLIPFAPVVAREVQALLLPENTGPIVTGEWTGSLYYELVALQFNWKAKVYTLEVTSDIACALQVRSFDLGVPTYSLTDLHDIGGGVPWKPATLRPLDSGYDRGLRLYVSSAAAKLRVTYYGQNTQT